MSRGVSVTFTVTLSSADTGAFTGTIRIGMEHPNDNDAVDNDTRLRAVFLDETTELYVGCDNDTMFVDPANDAGTQTFLIVLENPERIVPYHRYGSINGIYRGFVPTGNISQSHCRGSE